VPVNVLALALALAACVGVGRGCRAVSDGASLLSPPDVDLGAEQSRAEQSLPDGSAASLSRTPRRARPTAVVQAPPTGRPHARTHARTHASPREGSPAPAADAMQRRLRFRHGHRHVSAATRRGAEKSRAEQSGAPRSRSGWGPRERGPPRLHARHSTHARQWARCGVHVCRIGRLLRRASRFRGGGRGSSVVVVGRSRHSRL